MVVHALVFGCSLQLKLILFGLCLLGLSFRPTEQARPAQCDEQNIENMQKIRGNLTWQELKKDFELHKAPRFSLLVTAAGQRVQGGRNIILMMGPPGGGKGTQSKKVAKDLNIPHLSTGDMLRDEVAEGTEIGKQADAIMQRGGLVGDDIVMGIVKHRISKPDCANGFVLDGFPRTLAQAESLDKLLAETDDMVTKLVNLKVPDDDLIARVAGRWVHKASGRMYNVLFHPPKSLTDGAEPSSKNMKDDETGEPLEQRKDDTKEAVTARIATYHNASTPILEHYRNKTGTSFYDIDGRQPIDAIANEIASVLDTNRDAGADTNSSNHNGTGEGNKSRAWTGFAAPCLVFVMAFVQYLVNSE